MNTCSNCYSGCVEIQSDKCIKYTGKDIPVLGIKNGDSINYVQAAVMGFLVSTLDGSGIKYDLDPSNLCTIVSNELADCTDITVVAITNALSAVVCALDSRVVNLETFVDGISAGYTPNCIPGVTGSEGTHVILQAVINHICTIATDLNALELNVSTNYVRVADINTYIANYIDSTVPEGGTGDIQRDKMVPYTVVEYYGSLSFFDATGAGTGDWAQIYLCNGNNDAPDKRGRIPVGATTGMGGGSFTNTINPSVAGNPDYELYTTEGRNTVILTAAQLASHTHSNTAVASITDDHQHIFTDDTNGATSTVRTSVDITAVPGGSTATISGNGDGSGRQYYTSKTKLGSIGASITMSNSATGGGDGHSNIPPVLGCYYIIYIPTV